jgi:hypothetical protein
MTPDMAEPIGLCWQPVAYRAGAAREPGKSG